MTWIQKGNNMENIEWVRLCQRDYAWNEAVAYYLDNGTHIFADVKAKRCVASGQYKHMTDICWAALIAAYPRPDIADIASAYEVELEDL